MKKAFVMLGAAVGLAWFPALTAAEKVDVSKLPPAAAKQGVVYVQHVKPILEKSCFQCHGPQKAKGKLRLDTLDAALKGSDHGQVIKPGLSAESLLTHVVARLQGTEAMPPKGKGDPLTREQVGLIRAWIDQGAK
jgi:mono/diheme cytochrome c family protein